MVHKTRNFFLSLADTLQILAVGRRDIQPLAPPKILPEMFTKKIGPRHIESVYPPSRMEFFQKLDEDLARFRPTFILDQ